MLFRVHEYLYIDLNKIQALSRVEREEDPRDIYKVYMSNDTIFEMGAVSYDVIYRAMAEEGLL